MSKTPYQDLTSQDILSAHISGIQHDINKIQDVLDMKTGSVTDHILNPVTDQDDPSLRYRIYEGSLRNWLDNPTPVIYRNGVEVDASEYVLQASYGVIVFNEQQNANDEITADFDYIIDQSNKVESMQNDIDSLIRAHSVIPHLSGYYRSNNIINTDISTGANFEDNKLVAVMFIVSEPTTYDDIAIRCTATYSGSSARFGLYDDNGSLYPNRLLVDSGQIMADSIGVKSYPISLTLDRGIYWLVTVTSDNNAGWGNIDPKIMPHMGIDPSLVGNMAYGYEMTHDPAMALPDPFPSGQSKRFVSATYKHPAVFLKKA